MSDLGYFITWFISGLGMGFGLTLLFVGHEYGRARKLMHRALQVIDDYHNRNDGAGRS